MCLFNGGDLRYYPAFRSNVHGSMVYQDLRRSLTRETGWEAVMRVRCSNGHTIRNYIGSFHRRSRDLMSIPVVHADTTIAMDLVIKTADATISENSAYIQCALLYTHSNGERRIRIHNLPLQMAQSEADLFNGVDMAGMTAWVAKQAAIKLTLAPLAKGRVQIQEAVTLPCKSWAKYSRRPLITE